MTDALPWLIPLIVVLVGGVSAALVRFWCVMTMSWEWVWSSRKMSSRRPRFTSSSAASTSSMIRNGLGRALKIETRNATAVSDRSPPESSDRRLTFLPAGRASTSMPVVSRSDGSVSTSLPSPPGKRVGKTRSNIAAVSA